MEKIDLPNASKREDGDGVDLIGNMPDDILVLILSRLESTEEAIRSSILCRRWRYLWTAIPSLDLYLPSSESDEQYENNKEFVCWVLGKISVDLDSFSLSSYGGYNMSTVGRWIQMAVAKNVKELNLMLDDYVDIELPHCLVTCASLEVLRLSSFALLIWPSFSGFRALRVLELVYVELFDNNLVTYFLESCCPLLEDLTLEDCNLEKLDLLCISCPKLKKLEILMYNMKQLEYNLCGCLKLSCPKLVYLDFFGQIASNYIVERLYSLKEAEIRSDGKTELQLLLEISHVESLTTDLHLL